MVTPSQTKTNRPGLTGQSQIKCTDDEEQGVSIMGSDDDEKLDPNIPISAVIVPTEDEMVNRVRELEETKHALELEQKALEQTILEEREQQQQQQASEPIFAIAVKMIDDDDDDGEVSISSFRSHGRRRLVLLMFMGVVILAGTILGMLLPGNTQGRKSSSNSSTSIVPMEVTNLVDRLLTEYADLDTEQLLTDGTPQNRAIDFMALKDDWTREATSTSVSVQMIGERYALVVMYYATDGKSWNHEVNWLLNTTSVCEWNSPKDTLEEVKGVSCNDDGLVVGLDLGEFTHGARDENKVPSSIVLVDSLTSRL